MIRISPVIVGKLHCTDIFGNVITPSRIVFSGPDGNACVTVCDDLYGERTLPVLKESGNALSIPGFEGMACTYRPECGDLTDFSEDCNI